MNVTGTIQATDITGRLQSTDITGTISEIDNLDDFYEIFWSNYPGVLFFGLLSELEDGQIPNKVTGSSDYLTVSGLPGEEVFQCPNEPQYIAADTDFIWFKTDQTPRLVTTAELIGYDLQRTPVRYDDDSPNTIRVIMILNTDIDPEERDQLFADMWLPILWDNSFSFFGRIKSNRIGQILWTPEAVYEPELLTYIGLTSDVPLEQLDRLNDLVINLKQGLTINNISDYFDVLVVTAGDASESSRINLCKDAHHGVLGGVVPLFVQYEGFKSAGLAGYIDTNFNPATQGVNYTQLNNCIGVYVREDVAAAAGKTIAGNGTYSRWMLRYSSGDTVRGSNNGVGIVNPLSGNTASKGFYLLKRDGNNTGASKNGNPFTVVANSAAALNDTNYFILGDSNAGVFRYGTDDRISCYMFCKAPSDAEAAIINSAIETYMDSNLKGIQ